ncbi:MULTISPECIES: alpha/beta hydrolase [Streptomyces]|uniref:Lipase n=4 Tax=Streptomyces TaxID=1883 RepID=A0A8H9HKC2_9ACTN|nr:MULTISPECIES: alpha/beta hydrolase [Streptomyces]MDQ0294576.1 acetyl esterase/lipase [Streptomyces sp. DSM 41037]PJM83015.1 alpha/beta hydrolase [Streptomyces sp. TSRI0384-2]QNE81968.1 alpha/beta fold hydrolase [Streptomyces rutgersensis]RPK90533.1 Alpha/beta hydrolase family protein [Streptomyces sp. ADI98-12]SUP57900.1 lipase/esterase [Streptomyces griseus]
MSAARSAAERAAAEETALFAQPEAAPDVTAAYGPEPDQVVDFYAPRGPGAAPGTPLVVVVHGGAWRAAYDRRHLSPFAAFLAGRGFAVASVEYRRGDGGRGAGRWPDTLDDVAAAFDALPGLAAEAVPEADPGRTVLTGHSAGGHLALWAAARHVLPAGSPWRLPRPPAVRGVVALAPIADFAAAAELDVCGGAFAQFLGEEYEERLAHADPVALLPTGIATTLVQGSADTEVPPAVAEAYADAATAAGEMPGFTLVDGVGHFPLIDPASAACALVAEEIAQLAW